MKEATWIDITRPMYPGMPVWPGDHEVEEEPTWRIANGDGCNVTAWTFSNHAGTHVDPPLHFLADAAPVPEMDVNVLCGACRVLDLSHLTDHVRADDLAPAAGAARLLMKTPNSVRDPSRFHEDFLALTLPAARWLIDRGVRLIGVDGPSIEPFHAVDHPVHRAILEAGIAVVEGLDLRNVEPGSYELICAPLLWQGGDGSPCRALLRPIPD